MPPYNATSWKKLVTSLTDEVEFGLPAAEARVEAVEQSLRMTLPPSIRDFLREVDGLKANYSEVIWSVAEIERRNRDFRTNPDFLSLYMPFDHLLFFGGDGGGNQFAFAIDGDGEIRRPDIYCWEHESDSRSWFAGRLEQFFEKSLNADTDAE